MRLHLALGLGDEAETDAVSGDAGGHAQKEAAGIPDGIQPARPPVEFLKPLSTPGQVVLFLFGGLEQMASGFLGARHDRLAAVKSLCRDLTGVVDAHERDAVAAGVRRKVRLGNVCGRGRAGCHGRSRQSPQRLVGGRDERVEFVGSRKHGGIIAVELEEVGACGQPLFASCVRRGAMDGRSAERRSEPARDGGLGLANKGCPHAPARDTHQQTSAVRRHSPATRFNKQGLSAHTRLAFVVCAPCGDCHRRVISRLPERGEQGLPRHS